MTRIAQIVVVISTCLWLGGLVALFLFVGALFKHDRTVAIQSAPVLFDVFAKYQLVVGLVGLIALMVWRSIVRSSWISAIAVLFALSLVSAAYVTFSIIPEMEAIRLAGQSGDSPRFKQLHGRSMIFYSSQTIALFVSAIMLPGAIGRRADESVRAINSPGVTADRGSIR
jgi:hypothetical protein